MVRFWLCNIPYRTFIMDMAWSSAVANFITWNKAYSLFPFSTFIQRHYFMMRGPFTPYGDHLEDRRFKTKRATQARLYPRCGSRIPGDRYTWCIPLDTTGIESSHVPDFVIENSSSQVEYDPVSKSYSLIATPFSEINLRYKFTRSPCWVPSAIEEVIVSEMEKTSSEDQSENIESIRENLRRSIDQYHKPKRILDSGPYYDEKVPGWYQAWENEARQALLMPD